MPATNQVSARDTTSYPQAVTFIKSTVADAPQLPHAPKTLGPDIITFLNRFQPSANKVSATIFKGNESIVSNGWCYAEYPCLSITAPATVEIRGTSGNTLPGITHTEMTGLLTDIMKTPAATFTPSFFNGINSLKYESNGIDLTIYAFSDSRPSDLIAGSVFDLYKIHSDDTSTNAVRGVQLENQVAICLTPVGADPTAAQDFCVGRELNGAMPAHENQPPNVIHGVSKRGGSLGAACGLAAAIPIIGWLAAAFCSTF